MAAPPAWQPPPPGARSTAGEPLAVGPHSQSGPAHLASRQVSAHSLSTNSPTSTRTRTGKLTYEKLHASKYAKQQELKIARQGKTRTAKDSYKLKGAIETKQLEWYKAHEGHVGAAQIEPEPPPSPEPEPEPEPQSQP